MKEVKEWDNNPREMFVWDDNPKLWKKKLVVYIKPGKKSPVLTLEDDEDYCRGEFFKHAAEIEENSRLMTKQELSWWLRDGKHREWSYECINVWSHLDYPVSDADEPVDDHIVVRENGGKWVKPLISLLLD